MAPSPPRPVVVTGANGLVGRATCAALAALGVPTTAVVRRAGTAPALDGLTEHVGEFDDPDVAEAVVRGARAVITTVHPMGSDETTQRRVGVEGTARLAEAARDAGVDVLVHVSTAAVYDRSPTTGDVDEGSHLVGDDAGAYATTKRDADRALAAVEGLTSVLVRPPAILGPGATSVWNTLRPRAIRDDADERRAVPSQTFPWVHVADLARLLADVAAGRIATAADPDVGPVLGTATPVDVAATDATMADYLCAVCDAVGVDPVWQDGEAAWTGAYRAARARAWGWRPAVDLDAALGELQAGLRRSDPDDQDGWAGG